MKMSSREVKLTDLERMLILAGLEMAKDRIDQTGSNYEQFLSQYGTDPTHMTPHQRGSLRDALAFREFKTERLVQIEDLEKKLT